MLINFFVSIMEHLSNSEILLAIQAVVNICGGFLSLMLLYALFVSKYDRGLLFLFKTSVTFLILFNLLYYTYLSP